jgi:hypothetical protein
MRHVCTPLQSNFMPEASGIESVNTSAFLGTNPTGELITSGLPVTQDPASVFFPTVQNLAFVTPSDFTFPHKASLAA